MYRTLLATLSAEVSGVAAKNLIARISQWHRIQASPMYREAAEWVHATLHGWGLDTVIERYEAREGAIAWAQAQLAGETIQRPVVVLVTDGAPFGCHTDPNDVNNDIANLAALAEKAYAEHGILTYVVGLEGSWEWIVDKIAASGGTGKALLVSNEQTYEELFAALQAIKESHVDCEVGLPPDSDLSELDPQTVNVTYTPGSGSHPLTLQQVDGAAACGEGWYYDDPVAPTKISLCPETCALIQADKSARLDVLIGCHTQIAK